MSRKAGRRITAASQVLYYTLIGVILVYGVYDTFFKKS